MVSEWYFLVITGKFLWSTFTSICFSLMMMNFFCGMVDQRKAFNLISGWGHCQRSSSSRISNKQQARFEPVQHLSSGLVWWSCAVATTITPRHHNSAIMYHYHLLLLQYHCFYVSLVMTIIFIYVNFCQCYTFSLFSLILLLILFLLSSLFNSSTFSASIF